MSNNSLWAEIYQKDVDKKGGNLSYTLNKIKKKKKLINLVKKYANKNIIECGCGTSVVSIYLASQGYNVTAVDIDYSVIKLAKKLSRSYYEAINKTNAKINFIKQSIFSLNYEKDTFDVAFSNGVLEHFNDDDITKIIKQQLFIAKTTIVGIPTNYFSNNDAKYGNERVLKLNYWRQLIKEAGGIIIEEVGMHREPFYKRLFNFKKYFKPKPYHLFVVKKK